MNAIIKGVNEAGSGVKLWVNGRPVKHVVRHSPTGMSWGYAGSGPADTAYSILLMLTTPQKAQRHYQSFKHDFVAVWPVHVPEFEVVIEFTDWLRSQAMK